MIIQSFFKIITIFSFFLFFQKQTSPGYFEPLVPHIGIYQIFDKNDHHSFYFQMQSFRESLFIIQRFRSIQWLWSILLTDSSHTLQKLYKLHLEYSVLTQLIHLCHHTQIESQISISFYKVFIVQISILTNIIDFF